jgi:predicted phosphodiesterase
MAAGFSPILEAMRFPEFFGSFESFLAQSPREALGPADRVVVISDLHLGNGKRRDDLVHNRDLVLSSLRRFYLAGGWTLVLNGDIEDLSKFDYGKIRGAWGDFYDVVGDFHARGRLRRIIGNHDLGLQLRPDYPWPILQSLVLEWRDKHLFLFHGHQASGFYMKYDRVQDFLLRWLARPLGIRNRSVAGHSRKRFATERKIYKAARTLGIVAIAGHTHRPFFESLSKWDSLRWSIERLLDDYAGAEAWLRTDIRELIGVYREELERMGRKDRRQELSRSLYDGGSLLIPCYFNSGAGIGKHGYTALELEDSSISLVHWSRTGTRAYIEKESVEKKGLEGTGYARYVIRRDGLDRVFDRIELLAGSMEGW